MDEGILPNSSVEIPACGRQASGILIGCLQETIIFPVACFASIACFTCLKLTLGSLEPC